MLDIEFRQSAIGEKAQYVFQQVKGPDFEVLDLPASVLQSMLRTSASNTVHKQIVSKAEFYGQWFLPNIAKADLELRDQLVISALLDDDIRSLLQNCDCVPVRPNGILRKPSDLVDPNSSLAILYDEEDDRFPLIKDEHVQRHGADNIYSRLVSIGMKRDNLSWKELAERCSVVTQRRKLVSKRLKILTQLMSRNVDTVSAEDDKYIDRIRQERFLPVKRRPHGFLLPWKGDDVEQYTSCNESYLSEFTSLVCCSYPIVHENDEFRLENFQLKRKLQMIKPINEQTVLHQLDCIISHMSQSNKREKERTTFVSKTREFCNDIYRYFEKLLEKQECSEVIQELCKRKCILVHSKDVLMYPQQCARQMPVDSDVLLPYLYAIPCSMSRLYGTFLEAVGVKNAFVAEDYVGVVRRMKDEHSNIPLSGDDLKVAIAIVNNCLPECSELPDTSSVYVPNTAAILCTADTICMNINCDWISTSDIEGNICHEKIAPGAARKLGIRTIRQEYLMQNSDDFGLPFGQDEELTTRLHNIIRDYRCDETVLKEMLQNADDAGATKLHLINDMRTLPDRRVFDDNWKPLQGPALCVYNDKPFTEEDLRGIQNLGKGSKGTDATKTGQYGVGFNCVYHLTDVPTLLTSVNGEQILCVFDPHYCYIQGASKESRGRKLKNIEQLKAKYPDIFQGYLLAEYEENGGSIFRLPLRNKEMSKKSKITNNTVTSDTVQKLFTAFQRNMNKSLLFLNSVEEIHLRIINADSANGTSWTNFCVTAKVSEEARRDREMFMNAVRRVAKELKSKAQVLDKVPALEKVCYELRTEDSEGNVDDWLIVQCLGFDSERLENSDGVCISDTYASDRVDLLPRAGIAHLTSSNHDDVGRNQLFCFLPLTDADLDIPVNVNGHFFLNCEARQNLWAERNGDWKSQWNLYLMKYAVAPAYCELIERRRQEAENLLKNAHQQDQPPLSYFSVFPPMSGKEDSYITTLCKSVYQRLQDAAVLPVYSFSSNQFIWLKPSNHSVYDGFFDDLHCQLNRPVSSVQQDRRDAHEKKQVKRIDSVVRNVLLKAGMKIFHCPVHICTNFTTAGVSAKVLRSEDVLEFFRTYRTDGTPCMIQEVNKPIAETLFEDVTTVVNLLKYCVLAVGYKQLLIGAPLLVTSDNHLRLFDELRVKYEPRFSGIFPHIPEQFMHKSVFHALELNLGPSGDTHLCKKLTIHNFVEELPRVLPTCVFHGEDKRIRIDDASQCLTEITSLSSWIRLVWNFLHNTLVKSDQILKQLQLRDWCILPAKRGGEEILVPIRYARCVIAIATSTFAKPLDAVLEKIGVLRPSHALTTNMEVTVFTFYHSCLGSGEKPDSVLAALREVFKTNGFFNCALSVGESSVLQKYFTDNIEVISTTEAADTVRQLPIFRTVYHKMVSIDRVRAYIITDKIPPEEVENICAFEQIILLKSEDNSESLLKHLGCTHMHVVTFYCDYVFQNFHMLSDVGRLKHILYIKDFLLRQLESKKENSNHLQTLLRCLKNLAFIRRSTDTTLAKASEFYDNSIELLRVMHEETDFPPHPYKGKDWTDFLRKCGLVHEVSQDMFLRYCKQVADSGIHQITDRVHAQSKALLKYLFSHEDLRYPAAFVHKLRTVKFIVPHSVGSVRESLCSQHGNVDGGLRLVEFANSIGSKWTDAVWSVQNVVPHSVFEVMQKCGNTESICSELKFHQKPVLSNVVKHTQQLCKQLVLVMKQTVSPAELKAYIDILHTIYKVLSDVTEFPENARTSLSETSFIIDGERKLLVRPNQLVLRLSKKEEISPYLISMPRDILAYERVFCQLGASESPSLDQYVMVLKMIHIDSRGEVMHPNERKKVKKAMGGLFVLLQSSEDRVTINDELYLPGGETEEWKMYQSSTLMFDDAQLRSRLRSFEEPFMLPLRECGVFTTNYSHKDLLKRLPTANRPKFLSEVVHEIVEDGWMAADCAVARRISEKFSSEDFRDAVMRLALYNLMKTPTEKDVERVKMAAQGLQAIRIRGVENLTTYLMYNGNRIQDSDCEKLYHVHRASTEHHVPAIKIFVHADADKSPTLSEDLTEVVNCIMGGIIKSQMYLLKIIECEAGMENEYLDHKNIPQYGTQHAVRDSFVPIPGSFVPLIYHCLLKQDVQLLNPGDFAAMETDDPMEYGESDSPTYILVKVVGTVEDVDNNQVPPAHRHYKVLVGPNNEIVVSALELYAFTRDQDEIEQTSDSSMEVCVLAPESRSSARPQQPADYNTIIKDLKKQLKDAWEMPEPKRKKFVKRLLLRWHPDKNRDNQHLATEVTKFILNALDRLERGLPINEEEEDTARSYQYWSGRTDSSWGGFHRTFYEHMNQQQQQQRNRGRQRHRGGGLFRQFYAYPNPQPGAARHWLRQAKADIDAAVNDEGCGRCCAFEWACYKYYQASAKALRGAQFARDAGRAFQSLDDVRPLAAGLGDDVQLREWASELHELLDPDGRLRYPAGHEMRIPRDLITQDTAERAKTLCSHIVNWCMEFINRS